MANIKNHSFDSIKIIIAIMVLLNLFCYACSSNDSGVIRRNIKGRLGTHWNRIGKRLESKQQEPQESQEINASFLTNNELCNDLLMLKHLAEKYEVWMKLEQFISKFLLLY